MKLTVKVHPNSKNPRLEKSADGLFDIYVKESPQQGKANEAVVEALSEYFKIPKTTITLVRGGKSKIKIFNLSLPS